MYRGLYLARRLKKDIARNFALQTVTFTVNTLKLYFKFLTLFYPPPPIPKKLPVPIRWENGRA